MDYSFLESKSIFALVVGGLGLVGAVAIVALLGAGPTEMGYAIAGGVVTAGIVIGTYLVGRRYGHPHSHAVAEAAVAFGTLYMLTLTFRLLTEFGTRSTTEVVAGMGAAVVGTVLVVALTVALGRFGPSPS